MKFVGLTRVYSRVVRSPLPLTCHRGEVGSEESTRADSYDIDDDDSEKG